MALDKGIQYRCILTAYSYNRTIRKDQTKRNSCIDLLLMLDLTCRYIYQHQCIVILQNNTGFLLLI